MHFLPAAFLLVLWSLMPMAQLLLPGQPPSVVHTSEGHQEPWGVCDPPGARVWTRLHSAPSGSSDVSKWISVGCFFRIWSDSVGRVPPASHWGELSSPWCSGNRVGEECRERLHVHYGRFHHVLFSASGPGAPARAIPYRHLPAPA